MLTESTKNNGWDAAHEIYCLPSNAFQAHMAAYLQADAHGSFCMLEA